VHILAEIEEAEQHVRRDQVTPSGKLRVQLPIELGMHVLGRLMVEFARETPELSLQLELSSRHIDIIEEQYDLAIRIGAMPDSSLVGRKILSIKRGIYASSRYLNQYGEPQSLEELQRHSCLRFHTDYQSGDWVLTGAMGPVTFRPAGPIVANNLTVLREAAICGLGIAVLPCLMCRAAIESGQLQPVLERWLPDDAEVFVLYPSREHLSMKVRGFLAFLDRRLDQLSTWINAPVERLSPPDADGGRTRPETERNAYGESVAHLRPRSTAK
jgi:DNA-binding transcriptional LysR family regulator